MVPARSAAGEVVVSQVLDSIHRRARIQGIGWRPDGKLLAAACWDFRVYVWDADSGSLQRVLEGHKSVVHRVDFHPTQNLLVSHAWDGTTRIWNLADGSQVVCVDGTFLRFDREGRYLAFANNRQLGLWEMAVNAECQMLCGNSALTDDIHVIAFSPDGRLLASGSTIGPGVRLWDLATFREVALVPTGPSMAVGFHPTDGSLIPSGEGGLCKWPIQPDTQDAETLQIGPYTPVVVALLASGAHALIRLTEGPKQ